MQTTLKYKKTSGKKRSKNEPSSLQYVLDWFLTRDQIKIWHDGNNYCGDDEIIEGYNGYKKTKVHLRNYFEF